MSKYFLGIFPLDIHITERFLKILGNSSNICIFHHKIFCPLPLTINKTPEGFLLIIKYSQENEILFSTTLFEFQKKNYPENTLYWPGIELRATKTTDCEIVI